MDRQTVREKEWSFEKGKIDYLKVERSTIMNHIKETVVLCENLWKLKLISTLEVMFLYMNKKYVITKWKNSDVGE